MSPDPEGMRDVSPYPEGTGSISSDPSSTGLVSPDPEGTGSVSPEPSGTSPVSPDPEGTGADEDMTPMYMTMFGTWNGGVGGQQGCPSQEGGLRLIRFESLRWRPKVMIV